MIENYVGYALGPIVGPLVTLAICFFALWLNLTKDIGEPK